MIYLMKINATSIIHIYTMNYRRMNCRREPLPTHTMKYGIQFTSYDTWRKMISNRDLQSRINAPLGCKVHSLIQIYGEFSWKINELSIWDQSPISKIFVNKVDLSNVCWRAERTQSSRYEESSQLLLSFFWPILLLWAIMVAITTTTFCEIILIISPPVGKQATWLSEYYHNTLRTFYRASAVCRN